MCRLTFDGEVFGQQVCVFLFVELCRKASQEQTDLHHSIPAFLDVKPCLIHLSQWCLKVTCTESEFETTKKLSQDFFHNKHTDGVKLVCCAYQGSSPWAFSKCQAISACPAPHTFRISSSLSSKSSWPLRTCRWTKDGKETQGQDIMILSRLFEAFLCCKVLNQSLVLDRS